MKYRVTIMLDEKGHEKARKIQAALIKRDNKNYSFSKVIQMMVNEY